MSIFKRHKHGNRLDIDLLDFMVTNPAPDRKCKHHPNAPNLLVDDDQIGKCTSYCLGCIYEQLKKLPIKETDEKES